MNKFAAGDRVKYFSPELGTMTGLLEEGGMGDDPLMFMPDEKFHARLIRMGYEPEAGLFTVDHPGDCEGIVITKL